MSDQAPDALPEGWALTRMGEVFEINPPRPDLSSLPDTEEVTFIPMGAVDDVSGTITAPQIRRLHEVATGYTVFQEGDIIMAKITPCMENGKAAIATGLRHVIAFGSTEFHVLRAPERTTVQFLFHFIRQPAFRKAAEGKMTGTGGLKRVPAQYLKEHLFPLPPLAEQKRIVAKVDFAMQQARTNHAEVEDGFASVRQMREKALTDACSGKLTAEWRDAHPDAEPSSILLHRMAHERKSRWSEWHASKNYQEPEKEDAENLGTIPPTWVWATFDECSVDITVGYVGTLKGKYVENGIPFLRTQNARPLRFNPDGTMRISPEFHRSIGKSKLTGGELLVTRSGANVGDCCVYPRDAVEANCADLVITRTLTGLLAEYAAIYVCSQDGQSRLLEKGTGIAQPHFNIGAMRRKPFPLPPLEEQVEIVRCVNAALQNADKMQAQLRSTAEQADDMVLITVDRAFRGELVPTEASLARAENRSYEDGQALLERIQRDRAARPLQPRRTKSNRNSILKGRAMKKLIDEVLLASAAPLTAEKLFKETGRSENEVEQFFVELRRLERDGRLTMTVGPVGETLLSIPSAVTAS